MKTVKILSVSVLCVGLAIVLYLHAARQGSVSVNPESDPVKKEAVPDFVSRSLRVSGWLPYWGKDAGIASLAGKMELFDEIDAFAFGVKPDGSLTDTARVSDAPWTTFRDAVKDGHTAIIPTILWGDAAAMHRVFTDEALLARHVDELAATLDRDGFSGVDIDYEGKDVADRDAFSMFLTALHERLSSAKKTVSCTVEARTDDTPPSGWSGTRAMAYANDYAVLDRECDEVRIMAYDEAFQVHGEHQSFESADTAPIAPNADITWVEAVMRYALRSVAPEKLMIGVPTYGWEFRVTKTGSGYRYERVRSIDYPEAMAEAKSAGVTPERTNGGELSFIYHAKDGEHVVTFDDAESLQQKIELAKRLGLKGASLFKLDGGTDPELFSAIAKEVGK